MYRSNEMTGVSCRICENPEGNTLHRAREMMYGTREEFTYLECGSCGTLQITEIPELSNHYPSDYYSFSAEVRAGKTPIHRLAAWFLSRHFMVKENLAGRIIQSFRPGFATNFPPSLRSYPLGIDLNSRILDFGCGNGQLLQTLHYFGFRNLTGADAYISKDISYKNGVRVYKKPLEDFAPAFDLIMSHHSFEHVPNPRDVLREAYRLLEPGRYFLIRMPVAAEAWKRYGVNWVQLDPPRHLFIFSEETTRRIAEEAGFRLEKVIYDSTAFQFWGSEQYLRDIPLMQHNKHGNIFPSSVFSRRQMLEWEREAEMLNAEGRGDAACFYLKKPAEKKHSS